MGVGAVGAFVGESLPRRMIGWLGLQRREQVSPGVRVAQVGVAGGGFEPHGEVLVLGVAPLSEGFDAVVEPAQRFEVVLEGLSAAVGVAVSYGWVWSRSTVHTGWLQPGKVQHNSLARTSACSFLLGT